MPRPNQHGVYTLTAHDKVGNEVWVVLGEGDLADVGITIHKRNEKGEIIGFGTTKTATISRNELIGFVTEILTAVSKT